MGSGLQRHVLGMTGTPTPARRGGGLQRPIPGEMGGSNPSARRGRVPRFPAGTGSFDPTPQQDRGAGVPRRMRRGAIPVPQWGAVSPCPLGWASSWWPPQPGHACRHSGTLPADATSGVVAMAVADTSTAGLARPPRCWHCHAVSTGLGTGSRALARGDRSRATAGAIVAGAMVVGSHQPPAHAKLRTHAPGWLQWAEDTGGGLGQDT